MECRKCKKTFVEDRTVWPPDICGKCRSSTFKCVAEMRTGRARRSKVNYGPSRGRRHSEPSKTSFEPYPQTKTCGRTIHGDQLDPTVVHGLAWCAECRAACCHTCGKEEWRTVLKQDKCKRCGAVTSFCNPCLTNRKGITCVAAKDKIPPIYFDEITITPLETSLAKCKPQKKLPIYVGPTTNKGDDKLADGDLTVALRWANTFFDSLNKLEGKVWGWRKDRPLPEIQHTTAISLLAKSDHFRIILTYSHYDLSHLSNTIRKNHPDLKRACIAADPEIHYDKNRKKHSISRNGGGFMPYSLDKNNEHHAEMRAYTYAQAKGYDLVRIMPTKECCDECFGSLRKIKRLDRVPFWLRRSKSNRRTVDEEGGTLLDEERNQRFDIEAVAGDGNCFFHVLFAAGVKYGGANDAAELRTKIADGLHEPQNGPLRSDGVAVDTMRIGQIAQVIGRRIVLYEAHYGEGEWYERTDDGNHETIYMLLRSINNVPEGHYDRLTLQQ